MTLNMSPSALTAYEAEYTSGITVSPMAYMVLCVRFAFTVASIGATLDTGGWLVLARQGLSPCKRCQALLGALTFRLADITEPIYEAKECVVATLKFYPLAATTNCKPLLIEVLVDELFTYIK